MGKKGSWFSAVKKAIGCDSIYRKNRAMKLCKVGRCFGKQSSVGSDHGNALGFAVDVKLMEAENEQNRQAYSVALVTAMAAEAAVAAAHAAAEVVRLRAAACSKSQDEDIAAAVRIQAAFRGYLARREMRAFRGLLRLQALMGGHSLKQQAAETLQRMQTMARVRSEVRAWRLDSALVQQQIGISEMWRHAASMDLINNPSWGWNWMENGMVDWLGQKGSGADEFVSARSSTTCRSAVTKRVRVASEKSPLRGGRVSCSTDRDSLNTQSGQCQRNSIADSSQRDDDSLTATSHAVIPRYMASTLSTRAKMRSPSPIRQGKVRICDDDDDKGNSCRSLIKKRLSFSSCSSGSGQLRHSTPARLDVVCSSDTF